MGRRLAETFQRLKSGKRTGRIHESDSVVHMGEESDLAARGQLFDVLAKPVQRLAAQASKQIRSTVKELNLHGPEAC